MLARYGAAGQRPADGGRAAAAGRQGAGEVRLGDGPVPRGRPGRARHRLGRPQAPRTPRTRSALSNASGRRALRAGPLRPEDRRRLVPLRGGRARRRFPIRWSTTIIEQYPQGARHHAAQDQRRGDRRALHLRAGQRRRAHPRGRHRAARLRHRHRVPQRLRLPALPRRPDVLRRHGRPARTSCARCKRFAARAAAPRRVLGAGAAARSSLAARRQDLQLDSEEPTSDRSRHRIHRAHRPRQELEGRVQHDLRRHPGRRTSVQARGASAPARPRRSRGRDHGRHLRRGHHRRQHRARRWRCAPDCRSPRRA